MMDLSLSLDFMQVLHLEDLKEGRIVLSAPKFNAGVTANKSTLQATAEVRVCMAFAHVLHGVGARLMG